MAHHKRGKRKAARSGCLWCKPHKAQGNSRTAIDGGVLRRKGGDLRFERRSGDLVGR